MARVEWTGAARRDLDKLDPHLVKRILRKVDWLSRNFEKIVPEPLGGEFKETYKLRVGDWRVIYTVEKEILVIQFVGHIKEVYKTC